MMDKPLQIPVGLTTVGLLGRRYFARFIDSAILTIVAMVVAGASPVVGISDGLVWLVLVGPPIFVLWISYGAFLESSDRQATIGKRILGLRVYDSEGRRLSFYQAGLRNLVKDGPFLVLNFIPGRPLWSVLLLLAHVCVLHRSPVSQAIHDRVAHTGVAAPEETIQLRIT